MFISRLLREFPDYYYTQDYIRGVLVEITGIAIEVVILSIAVPLVFHFIHRVKTRPTRAAIDFYLFQIFHKITRMFLDIADVKDIQPILIEEMKHNPKFMIFSHFIYGNLENILFVLKKTFKERESFKLAIENKSLSDYEKYASICKKCLDELDRLTLMTSGLPRVQEELFRMRALIYPLRDLMENAAAEIEKGDDKYSKSFRTSDVQKLAQKLTEVIEIVFNKRRKLIDSMMKHHRWRVITRMVISLPYIFAHRLIGPPICRLRGKPYRDVTASSYIQDTLKEWRDGHEFTYQQAAERLEISVEEYKDYEYGYRRPKREVWVKIASLLQETPSKKQ